MLEQIREGTVVAFEYKNWRGEYSSRRVLVRGLYWGYTEYHPIPQFLLSGFDLDKNENRDFAADDITHLTIIGQEDN
jgi:predicted DNA-binding transcriptional regulator YafY